MIDCVKGFLKSIKGPYWWSLSRWYYDYYVFQSIIESFFQNLRETMPVCFSGVTYHTQISPFGSRGVGAHFASYGTFCYYQNTFQLLSRLGLEPRALRFSAQSPRGWAATSQGHKSFCWIPAVDSVQHHMWCWKCQEGFLCMMEMPELVSGLALLPPSSGDTNFSSVHKPPSSGALTNT